MSTDLKTILKNKAINKWNLFWLISIPMCTIMVIAMMGVDMSTGSGVSEMIGFAVRWAVYLGMVCTILLLGSYGIGLNDANFIYFQF